MGNNEEWGKKDEVFKKYGIRYEESAGGYVYDSEVNREELNKYLQENGLYLEETEDGFVVHGAIEHAKFVKSNKGIGTVEKV